MLREMSMVRGSKHVCMNKESALERRIRYNKDNPEWWKAKEVRSSTERFRN